MSHPLPRSGSRWVVALALAASIVAPRLSSAACSVLFDAPLQFNTDRNAVYMVTADFNEDGILDLAVTHANDIAPGHTNHSNVGILLGLGGRSYAAPVYYPTHDISHGITSGDFNEDGILDLAVANKSFDVSILLGQGSGGVGNGTFAPAVQTPIPGVGFGIVAGDFDRDGITDLAVALNESAGIALLAGLGSGGVGNGTFGPAGVVSLNSLSSGIVTGDFNHDGVLDLAATEHDVGTVGVRLGTGIATLGPGSFAPASHYPVDPRPFGLGTADFNHDGNLDLIAAGGGAGVRVLNGTASGTFTTGAFLASGNSGATTAADVDGDGFEDLATGHVDGFGGGYLAIFRGHGDGSFAPLETYPTGGDCYQVAAADFDGDGFMDVFVAPGYGNYVALLPGACGGLAPRITSFDPSQAPVGSAVTIHGLHFTGSTVVQFHGTSASFTVDADTQIHSTVPSGATTGRIQVTNPAGTGTSLTDFFVGPLPRIDDVSPSSGAPGQVVTIHGAAFSGADAVTFEGSGASFTLIDPSEIHATVPVPAHSGRVRVRVPSGTLTSPDSFIVAPKVLARSPGQAPEGSLITITGYNFTRTTSVKFNGTPAVFTLVSDAQIRSSVPSGATSGPIEVTNPGGSSASANFIVGPLPRVDSFTPTAGTPGIYVTIQGTGFSAASAVLFRQTPASYTLLSNEQIEAVVPVGARTGRVAVVMAPDTLRSDSLFIVAPIIESFTPQQAPEGHVITLSGHNFLRTTSVQFHGTPAVFSAPIDEEITATVPVGATDGPITVTNAGGTDASDQSFYVGPLTFPGGGINISWDDCGAFGAENHSFACDANTGPAFVLVASFTPPAGVQEYLGFSAQIDFTSATASLPDWWKHGSTQCRGATALSSNFDFTAGPFSCTDAFLGQAAGGYAYDVGFDGSPYRARLRVQAAIPIDNRTPIDPQLEYYAFKALIQRSKSTGTACAGCAEPMCLVLNEIQLFQPPERGFDPTITTPLSRTFVTWQGAIPGCAQSTPVQTSLVSADARADRVRLVWDAVDVEQATLYRREGSAAWRSLARLLPDGSHRLVYEDFDVAAGTTYDYRLGIAVGDGEMYAAETSVTVPAAALAELGLARVRWDGASRAVAVSFTLATRAAATLEIYDLAGRRWASRNIEGLTPGAHDLQIAQPLRAGVYFARLTQERARDSARFVVVP